MTTEEKEEITLWLDNPDRSVSVGKELGKKHIKNRHLLKTIDKSDDKAMRLLTYHLERRLNKALEEEADIADRAYFAEQAKKKAAEKPKETLVKKKEEVPVKRAEGLEVEKEPLDVEAMKKRAGDLSLQANMAHADMKKAATDAERLELAAKVVALDNERREIWNTLEGKKLVDKKPERVPTDAEKLAEIIRKGSLKICTDSLRRAEKKLREAETEKAKKSAQKSVDKYNVELAEINRLMGISNDRAES